MVRAIVDRADDGEDGTAVDGNTTPATDARLGSETVEGEQPPLPAGSEQPTTGPAEGSDAEADPEDGDRQDADPADEQPPVPSPDDMALPTSVEGMIDALDEAETAVRDPLLSTTMIDQWGRRQQALYRQLSLNPDWAPDVLAGADPTVADAVAANYEARRSLSALVAGEQTSSALPAWRVVPPLPAEELLGLYKQAESQSGIPWEFLASIHLIETRMGRIEGVSTAGALGPMQFLATTWAECCEGDPLVPADAIAGAAAYLTIRGGPDDMERAILGYNNSQRYVEAVTAYAAVMMDDERAYHGYHAWEVYFRTTDGLIRIPVGYEEQAPVPVDEWVAVNPETVFDPPPVDG